MVQKQLKTVNESFRPFIGTIVLVFKHNPMSGLSFSCERIFDLVVIISFLDLKFRYKF